MILFDKIKDVFRGKKGGKPRKEKKTTERLVKLITLPEGCTRFINPTRQQKLALIRGKGLSSRQYIKLRKKMNKLAKAIGQENPLLAKVPLRAM